MGKRSVFADRHQAGIRLAEELSRYRREAMVLGLPRGGVPVAAEVARALEVELDVFVVRKLGVPGHEELALGAVGSGGIRVLNQDVVAAAGLSAAEVEALTARELRALELREHELRGERRDPELTGRKVILVDDGLATGATMRAAAQAVRSRRPARLIVAVPVAPVETCQAIGREVDEVVCLLQPQPFVAVGAWYEDFSPVSEETVRELLVGNAGF